MITISRFTRTWVTFRSQNSTGIFKHCCLNIRLRSEKKQQGYARFNNSCIAWTYLTPAAVAENEMSNLVQYDLVKFYSMPTEKSAHCRKSMYLTYPKILYASTYWGKNKFWGEHQEIFSQQLAITCLHIFYSSLLSPPLISCL
jgi:hypothetical protein